MWKIRLTLQNGMSVMLNDVRSSNPGWSECDPSGIVKLEFSFLGKDSITGKDVPYLLILAGMKEYNFFIEAMKAVGSNKGFKITGLWFMGKLPDSEKITGFVLKDSILALNTILGKEYHGLPTSGWKKGIVEGEIVSTVIRRT